MTDENSISDMFVKNIDWNRGLLTVITENDHLLRRFGQVDVVKISQQQAVKVYRKKADEIWALISGQAKIILEDQREVSPSRGAVVELVISDVAPKAVLVPFGVVCHVSSAGEAMFLRLNTHQDFSHPEDRTIFV